VSNVGQLPKKFPLGYMQTGGFLMPRRVEAKPVRRKAGQPKILLVDDNEELRKAMGAVLGDSKFQVTTAANVTEALHLIDTQPLTFS